MFHISMYSSFVTQPKTQDTKKHDDKERLKKNGAIMHLQKQQNGRRLDSNITIERFGLLRS